VKSIFGRSSTGGFWCGKLAHDHSVYVSTGGWIENVVRFGVDVVDRYIEEARVLGFDVIEISTGLHQFAD
jgi:phosphosulfolactate synthase (CoM biosynthesis protein A)